MNNRLDEIRAREQAATECVNDILNDRSDRAIYFHQDLQTIESSMNDTQYLLSEVERLQVELEKQTALAQNGQSAIGTNLRLVAELERVTVERDEFEKRLAYFEEGLNPDIAVEFNKCADSILTKLDKLIKSAESGLEDTANE